MPYDNNNKGSLFRNERKRNENDPSHTGSCEINGQQFWLSAWIKEAGPQSKTPGVRFFSLSFKPKDAQQAGASSPPPARSSPPPRPAPAPEKPPVQADLEEDVPF